MPNYDYKIQELKRVVVIVKNAYYSGVPVNNIARHLKEHKNYKKWSIHDLRIMVQKIIYLVEMERKRKYEQISARIHNQKTNRFRE